MTAQYTDRHWLHFGRLVWTPTPAEWQVLYSDNQRLDGHDPGTRIGRECLWLFEMLICERPRTSADLARSTGIDYRVVDDRCWQLVQAGRIVIGPDSVMRRAKDK